MVGAHHPTIYKFVESLSVEQSRMETRRVRLAGGEQISLYAKAEYRANNERLKRLIDDYDRRAWNESLKDCSHACGFGNDSRDQSHLVELFELTLLCWYCCTVF